jgi:hypothetical protein
LPFGPVYFEAYLRGFLTNRLIQFATETPRARFLGLGGRENLLDVILWFTLLRHAAPETKRVRRSAHQQESLRASELLYLLSPNHILNSEAHSAPLGELTWPTLVTKNDIVACCACAGADKLIPVDATAAET